MPDLLIVAATAAEAAHVPAGVEVVITGIGKTAAAVATTRALAEMPLARRSRVTVLNIGTAGALHDGLEGLHFPGVVLNHDLSADLLRTLGHDARERLEVGSGDGATVLATGDVFVTDAAVRTSLAVHAPLVDMEGYAVVAACQEFGVRVELAKHVSDNADEGSMDWPTLVDASARVLGAWVRERVNASMSASDGAQREATDHPNP